MTVSAAVNLVTRHDDGVASPPLSTSPSVFGQLLPELHQPENWREVTELGVVWRPVLSDGQDSVLHARVTALQNSRSMPGREFRR